MGLHSRYASDMYWSHRNTAFDNSPILRWPKKESTQQRVWPPLAARTASIRSGMESTLEVISSDLIAFDSSLIVVCKVSFVLQ